MNMPDEYITREIENIQDIDDYALEKLLKLVNIFHWE